MENEKIIEALKKLQSEKRKFPQSIDLVVTLKGIDVKKVSIDFFITLSYKSKEKRVCLFAEKSVPQAEKIFGKVVLKENFSTYDKKASKNLAKEFDFFVSQAPVMASVASSFGKILGPAGKMPSPATGSVLTKLDERSLTELSERLKKTVRLRTSKSDSSLKLSVGNQNMSEEEIVANIKSAVESIVKNLPKGEENVRSILIKTTMGKPIRLELK